MADLKGD